MTEKEKSAAGMLYDANNDPELLEEMAAGAEKCFALNSLPPSMAEERKEAIRNLLGRTGEKFEIRSPFFCDYGYNIEVGENFFMNFNCVILDGAKVTFGDNVFVAPGCGFYTAGHPLHPDSRNSGYEYGIPVTIGNNVWIGGSCVILPGVTIGDNAVIGAGSVVTKDIPDNVCAAGNPCRVIREITEEDRPYYYKNRRFDEEVWEKIK